MLVYRRGHNFKTVGAEGIIKEVEECDKIVKEIDKIKPSNWKNINPPQFYGKNDVDLTIKQANDMGADFYFSVHMNCDEHTKDPRGVEVIVYNDRHLPQANRVLNNLVNLGFKNRGVKTMEDVERELGELKRTRMNAMIIEVCFVDSETDVNIYKKVGAKAIAKAIVEGVTGEKINNSSSDKDGKYRVIVGSYDNRDLAEQEKEKLIKDGYKDTFLLFEEGI